MGLEKTKDLLDKFNYQYEQRGTMLIIKLEFAQRIYINFPSSGKIEISDELTGWNFLTGLIEMSLKSAIVYNFIASLIFAIFIVGIKLYNPIFESSTFTIIYLLFIFWILIWFFFYLIKSENLKKLLIEWNS